MVSQDSTCTAAREASSAAASYSRDQRAAACGVRHNFQTDIHFSGNKITILCQSEHRKIPPHPKDPRLKKHFFSSRNPMYLLADMINAEGGISGTPSMQPTEQICTSPRGLRVSEHVPLYPSCVRQPECSFSQANATGALEACKQLVEVALTRGVEDQTGWP